MEKITKRIGSYGTETGEKDKIVSILFFPEKCPLATEMDDDDPQPSCMSVDTETPKITECSFYRGLVSPYNIQGNQELFSRCTANKKSNINNWKWIERTK